MIWFSSPIDGYDIVSSGWGDSREYRGEGQKHEGLDYRAPVGTSIFAAAPGVIVVADNVDDTRTGKHIVISHGQGWFSRYFHMDHVPVKKGQTVTRRQFIGPSGKTGIYNSAPHLHFDLRLKEDQLHQYVSRFGTPRTGFGVNKEGGIGVPSEPLIPVARYAPKVIERARANGIPVLGAGSSLVPLVLTVGAAYLAWNALS